jgi:16S rRNA (guanine966-N2)-methyltransferase
VRIISGNHRGRQLHPPGGLPVRPTTDLAKESLFNILNNRVDFEEISVLDLFAGTGNISFEFASRGAKQILAVDINNRCIDFIRNTAGELKFDNLFVTCGNVFGYLPSTKRKFDVIFADPPYGMREAALIPDLVFDNKLLYAEGWLIIEHPVYITFEGHPKYVEERRYGKVHFSFFRME